MTTYKRSLRKVVTEFSPVDSCAPMFYINSFVWLEGAMLETIETVGLDLISVKALPNGQMLSSNKLEIALHSVAVERNYTNA